MQNLGWKIFFQGQVKFLKSGIRFQFYSASNKDTFLTHPVASFKCKNIFLTRGRNRSSIKVFRSRTMREQSEIGLEIQFSQLFC